MGQRGIPIICQSLGCGGTQPCPLHPKTRSDESRSIETSERDAFYHSAVWLRLRKWFLALHPDDNPGLRCGMFCWVCREIGQSTIATDVDHIVPISEGGAPTDPENLQSLCATHHGQKTRTEQLARRKAESQ